jgi:hypothetical protein
MGKTLIFVQVEAAAQSHSTKNQLSKIRLVGGLVALKSG